MSESLKKQSRHLRGQILEELSLDRPDFTKETVQILKFHGVYQQTDRDQRKSGAPPQFSSMVRVGIPAGALTAAQYLLLDRLADEAGDGGLRLTTRQDVQFHRVGKSDLRRLIRKLNEQLLGTLAACGDVVRNVVCCPAPLGGPERHALAGEARKLAAALKPATRAYYEIWIDGERAAVAQSAEPDHEPLYGDTYLPRKFKIAFAAPEENCIDVYANDVGIVPEFRAGELEGFTLLVGGGLGMSAGVKASRPMLAQPLAFISPSQLKGAVEAIITIHRDFGNRANRKLARLKYVLEEWGMERFRQEFASRFGEPFEPPRETRWTSGADHLGWRQQEDGRWFVGLPVPSGRVRDGEVRWRTALREVVERFQPDIRLTAQQNLLLTGIPHEQRAEVTRLLRSHGVQLAEELPPVIRDAVACVALPTCGLAIAEAERVLPDVITGLRAAMERQGIGGESIAVRITGCPNGCARPYTAEIGIVGQSVDMYTIYLGASPLGTRLGTVFAAGVRRAEIAAKLEPVFAAFAAGRSPGESFGDFCHRIQPRPA